MPVVRAFNKSAQCIKGIGRTRNVHDDIASMEVENGPVVLGDETRLDYSTLSRILNRNSKKLQQISINNQVTLSAEYLAFLVSTFQKTTCLRLQDSFHDAAEFGCLVAGLAQPGGLRELQMSFFTPHNRDLNNHLLLLLKGIAFASSLERLHLLLRYRLDVLRPALIDAILMNRTLKSLCLDISWYADDGLLFPEVFQAAARNKHIQDLTLRVSGGRQPTLLKEEVWVPTLCHQECTIEKVCLFGIKFGTDYGEVMGQNTSVKELVIQSADLSFADTSKILYRFKSLVSVDLAFNNLGSISIFDNFLLGEEPTLESLNLECNNISEEDMMNFLTNLPKMKILRNLQLNGNPILQSRSCMQAFKRAVCSNTACLERAQYYSIGYEEKDDAKGFGLNVLPSQSSTTMEESPQGYQDMEKILMVQLSLNRFGRRHLLGGSSNYLPSNLWPLLLERASNLRYYSLRDVWKRPSLECTRLDVAYWLLREKIFV
ncbi:unnamed protein product [Cylindrotheca closterium]|uniref:Uncharacterized protein n=1 Tax=Cylindrotheca closterium TaxID=2856 RepID=A0AAD2JHE0_9STRA|nr:unnamed protein product [Cylindrotheca closterium]